MYLSSEEAFELIKNAGITKNKQTFLRYVREGKIKGEIRYKRDGYRFEEKTINSFIEKNLPPGNENPIDELKRLRKENEVLQHKLKIPTNVTQAENMKLRIELMEAEEKINQMELEIFHLEDEIKQLKNDNTIRIRVQ